MSGLDIFEELRYIIELLLAESMFAYYFAKKKKDLVRSWRQEECCCA